MSNVYLRFTEWENHRTQEHFERHVVIKLVLFEFVNTFLALFYIAFILQDISQLKSQLFTQLIISQIVNQLQETVLPIVLKKPSPRRIMNKIANPVDGRPLFRHIKRVDLFVGACKEHFLDGIALF